MHMNRTPAFELLRTLSWPELRQRPWRKAIALAAVALGVALAFAVHLINASALAEFGAAVRQVGGQPDFELRAQRGGFDEALLARVAAHPRVALASPVIEIETGALDARGERVAVRVIGIDALAVGTLAPALLPRPAADAPRLAIIDPGAAFLNRAAHDRLGAPSSLQLQSGSGMSAFVVRGDVAAVGPPLVVIDIAGVQAGFGWLGRLSRIDVRLVAGATRQQVLADFVLPDGVRAATPDESALRVSNLSRAYRINLSVLALVALFTGAFLVFTVFALEVRERQPQFALLGVLGLGARERLALVLAESALFGVAGSLIGIALGVVLAAFALSHLGGDLGGGYFPGVQPALQFSLPAACVHLLLGVGAALAGAWLPARSAQRLAPAQALKGLGDSATAGGPRGSGLSLRGPALLGPALLALGGLLSLAPPVAGLPIAAYAAVACLLIGGIACVPAAVAVLLRATPRHPLLLLAFERARDQRHAAAVAVAGVVASTSLAVALTVMVASFRDSVTRWLDDVLPADLYVSRAAGSAAADQALLPPNWVAAATALPQVARADAQRHASVWLDPAQPAVSLIARPLGDAERSLPLVGALVPPHADMPSLYVSEALAMIYRVEPGAALSLPLPDGRTLEGHVRGTWRDYARQHGAVAIDLADWRRATGDTQVNALALWLAPGADVAQVQQTLRRLEDDPGQLEFATPGEIRAVSLSIFDRSFAVTLWLQAVAIVIGLAGIAASFSAQVLARGKEFGLLAHLGVTRAEVLAIVAAEGAAWTAAGALVGLVLGLGVAVVLVHVVNPQSFHWTMELLLPWHRLALLFVAVMAAGTITAWLAGRRAARRDLALAVKEDW